MLDVQAVLQSGTVDYARPSIRRREILVNSPIFIVGPHRAGSTLWHNLVAMNPGILRLAEPRFLGSPGQKDFRFFLKTQGDLSDDQDIAKLVDLCFSRKKMLGLEGAFWRFEGIEAAGNPDLRKEVSRRIGDSDRSLGAIARIILEELTRFSGCRRPCVKFPVDVRHIPQLLEWFPDCKIIHITRDPRALAMSKSNDPSGTALKVTKYPRLAWLIRKATLWMVVGQYRLSARVHLRFKQLKNYRLFRYEDLLSQPDPVLRELCGFIETDFTEEMLEPQKGRHEHQPSSLTGKRRKAFDAAAAIRWQKVINPLDNLAISSLTKASMRQLGYDPTIHPIFQNTKPFKPETQSNGVS